MSTARAEAAFRSALLLEPTDALTYRALGVLLRDTQPSKASALLERSLELAPDDALASLALASLLQRRAGHEHQPARRAAGLYEWGLRLMPSMPDAADVYNNLGLAMVAADRASEAARAYAAALAIDPANSAAHTNTAALHITTGDAQAAAAAALAALRLRPEEPRLWLLLATAHPWGRSEASADDEARWITRMAETQRTLMHRTDATSREGATSLHFSLFKAHRGRGETAEAWRHLAAGNAARRAELQYDAGYDEERVRRTEAAYTPLLRGGRLPPPSGRLATHGAAPIFIVGFPRCGSTLLSQLLLRQAAPADGTAAPSLFDAGETCAWSPLLTAAAAFYAPHVGGAGAIEAMPRAAALRGDAWAELARLYADAMRERAAPAERWLSKMLDNFWHIGAIYLAMPRARVLHMSRAAVQSCFSAYGTLFAQGRDAVPYSYDLRELAAYHRAYTRMMRFWHRVVPPSFLMDVDYERLVSRPDEVLREVTEFVGIGFDAARLQQTPRPGAPVQTASSLAVRERVHNRSLDGWRPYEAQLAPLLRALEEEEGEGGGGGGDGAGGGGEEVVGDVEEPTPAVVVEATTPTRLSWSQRLERRARPV